MTLPWIVVLTSAGHFAAAFLFWLTQRNQVVPLPQPSRLALLLAVNGGLHG